MLGKRFVWLWRIRLLLLWGLSGVLCIWLGRWFPHAAALLFTVCTGIAVGGCVYVRQYARVYQIQRHAHAIVLASGVMLRKQVVLPAQDMAFLRFFTTPLERLLCLRHGVILGRGKPIRLPAMEPEQQADVFACYLEERHETA